MKPHTQVKKTPQTISHDKAYNAICTHHLRLTGVKRFMMTKLNVKQLIDTYLAQFVIKTAIIIGKNYL